MSAAGGGSGGGAGEGPGEGERPLKKARWAWQVKGRGRSRPEPEPRPEHNLEHLGDYLMQNESALDWMVSEARGRGGAGAQGRRSESAPVSLVSRADDQALERWQSRQVARGFIDNTINRVLDSWLFAPLPEASEEDALFETGDSRSQALGVAEFMNNLPRQNIENEGILMAISAHGLQNTPNGSYDENSNLSSREEVRNNNESSNKSIECDAPALRELNRPCICSHTLRNNIASAEVRPIVPFHHRDPLTPYAYLPAPSVLERQAARSSPPRDSASPESEPSREDNKVSTSSSENIFDEHFDFMDAAVSFAIQTKGLTSYGADYG